MGETLMSFVRLIAMDVDGTLYDRPGTISEVNLAALHKAQEKGVTVAIATGRTPANMLMSTRALGLYCPVIGSNGTHVVDENNNLIFEYLMATEAAKEAQYRLSQLDTEYNVVTVDTLCMSHRDNSYKLTKAECDGLLQYGQKCLYGQENARICAGEKVNKLFAYNCADIDAVRAALSDIPGIYLSRSGKDNVEIMPVGADKALGVRALADCCNISMNDVMTMGDEMNDLEMIRAAGWGVAMGNAVEALKKEACYVTEHCHDHGVSCAIWRYVL